MSNKRYRRWMRHPKTTAERRANQDSEYVRGKRMPHNLPDTYDDLWIYTDKCWKGKRKKQYRGDKRGEKHSIAFDIEDYHDCKYIGVYRFIEYLEDHDIRHNVIGIYRGYSNARTYYYGEVPYKCIQVPVWRHHNGKEDPVMGDFWLFREVLLDEPIIKWYNFRIRTGYRIEWWSDKDIGLDYILKDYING